MKIEYVKDVVYVDVMSRKFIRFVNLGIFYHGNPSRHSRLRKWYVYMHAILCFCIECASL
jgi:hypothetical protein